MLICRDLTKIKENLRLQEEMKAINLMMTCCGHELLTPLKCVDQLVLKIKDCSEISSENKRILNVIE
jgi:hypothetical protein